MVEREALHEVQDAPQMPDTAKRERSTIVFPYGDLSDAINVARGIHTVGGTKCQIDQLAAQLNHTVTSGAFQQRLNTARIFGLLTNSRGTVTLTSLGTRIVDPQQEKAAKVESFLGVPLYKKVYDHFKGTTLPPPSGLDATIEGFGVSAKQKDTARRVFQRSATQAGFFEISQDRLTCPSLKAGTNESGTPPNSENGHASEGNKKGPNGTGGDGGDGTRHPLIAGLIKALPAPGEWPLDARRKWLQAAAINFDFVYTDATTQGSIRVTLDKEISAN